MDRYYRQPGKILPKRICGLPAKNGVTLQEEEKLFSFFKKAYQDYFKISFDMKTILGEKFYFLNDAGELTAIGRSSKVVRDMHLLEKIEEAFKSYDRVFVVFGGAPAYIMEPALHPLVEKQKKNQ